MKPPSEHEITWTTKYFNDKYPQYGNLGDNYWKFPYPPPPGYFDQPRTIAVRESMDAYFEFLRKRDMESLRAPIDFSGIEKLGWRDFLPKFVWGGSRKRRKRRARRTRSKGDP